RAFLKEQKAFERFSSSLHVASVTSPNLTEAAGCKFYWNGGSGEFVATDRAEQTKFHERTFIFRTGKETYVTELLKKLKLADSDGNEKLAKEVTNEIRKNSIEIFYEKGLTSDFIHL